MTNAEIRAIENAGRSAMVWAPAQDEDRMRRIGLATLPALALLSVSTFLLFGLV